MALLGNDTAAGPESAYGWVADDICSGRVVLSLTRPRHTPCDRRAGAAHKANRVFDVLGCLATEQPIGIASRCDALANLNRAVNAAIDDDRLAGEVAGLQRAEIGAQIADFVRPTHAAHRDGLGEALELLVGRDA